MRTTGIEAPITHVKCHGFTKGCCFIGNPRKLKEHEKTCAYAGGTRDGRVQKPVRMADMSIEFDHVIPGPAIAVDESPSTPPELDATALNRVLANFLYRLRHQFGATERLVTFVFGLVFENAIY
jgi:hypothetical protein